MVYPALTALHTAGLTRVEISGARKTYLATESGLRLAQQQRDHCDDLLSEFARAGTQWQRLEAAMEHDAQGADRVTQQRAPSEARELGLARRALDAALQATQTRSPEEARRIAAILRRASAEILAPTLIGQN
jgi:DNA-binding PadR family transcriptional regulator